MKILYISDSLKFGGKEKQLFYLIKALSKHNTYDIFLFLKKNIIDYPDIKLLCKSIYISNKQKSYLIIKEINNYIYKFKPDIIHTWEGSSTSMVIPILLFRHLGLINGQIRYSRKYSVLTKNYLSQKFNTFFSSANVANSVAGLISFGLKRNKKNYIVHNGFDVTGFDNVIISEKIKKNNKLIIGKIANFTKPKDYNSIIKSAIILLERGYDLLYIFIGEGPEMNPVKMMIPTKFLNNFLFLGKRNDAEAWVKYFDICVLLSKKGHSEGLSNSIMEYMAAAKPVIATNVGGNPELISDGINGFLIPHEDVNVLVDKIEYLINNSVERKKMGKYGRRKIEKDFTVDKMVDKYLKIYTNFSK